MTSSPKPIVPEGTKRPYVIGRRAVHASGAEHVEFLLAGGAFTNPRWGRIQDEAVKRFEEPKDLERVWPFLISDQHAGDEPFTLFVASYREAKREYTMGQLRRDFQKGQMTDSDLYDPARLALIGWERMQAKERAEKEAETFILEPSVESRDDLGPAYLLEPSDMGLDRGIGLN